MSGFAISGKAARALSSLLRPKAGNSPSLTAANITSPDRAPDPWTVRWSEQNGCYVIFLTDPFNLLYWGFEAVGVSNFAQAQGMPLGWYKIEESTKESELIVLVVKYDPDTGDFISAKVQPYGGGQAKGTLNIVIAWPKRLENGALVMRQFVTSVIHLGSGGGGSCNCPEDVYPDYGQEEEKEVVTDVSWDEAYCKLVIKRAKIKLNGGHIVAWEDLADKDITTVDHSQL